MAMTTQNKLAYLSDTKTAIKDAIIEQGQTVANSDTFRSYADKIRAIETASDPVLENLNVTANGNYTPSEGVDGFGSVSVNVPDIPAVVQPLEVTENGTYTAPDGVDGYSPVTVNVPAPEVVLQDKTITENGTYTADSGYDGLGSVTVDVASSGGAAQVYYTSYLTLSGTVNSKYSVNFGFEPDFIMLLPQNGVTFGTKNIAFFGVSSRYQEALSKNPFNYSLYLSSGKVYTQDSYNPAGIDGTNDMNPIYSADSTGFKLGKVHPSGYYFCFACKLF